MEFVRNIPAHLDKHCGHKELMKKADHGIRNVGTHWGGTVSARYLKGLSADGDNLVIVQFVSDKSPLRTASAGQCTTLKD